MFKTFLKVILVVLFVLISFKITQAAFTFDKPFGGYILNTKAVEIKTQESSNYFCSVPGKSITIIPVGSYPASYVIKYATLFKSLNIKFRTGQWILGLYSPIKTNVTCTFQGTPPNTVIISLDTITLFGLSK